MRKIASGLLLGLAALGGARAQPAPAPADKYMWLEDVGGSDAMAWVGAHNATARKELEASARFPALHARLKTILNAKERIPFVTAHGDYVYNFWRDPAHVRGIWRRTTLTSFAQPEPAWETVIDIDQLARDENENWVWDRATCLKPRGDRCLVSLSRGGGDAHVVREFDLSTRAFVAGGFTLPESKGGATWIDRDTLFVSTDFGPGSMTSSGYPRIVKEWKRGSKLAEAATVYEARASDLSADAWKDFTPGHEHEFIERQVTFYSSELFLREAGKLVQVPKPDDARAWTVRGQLVIELRSEWQVGGATYPQGALLAAGLRDFMQGGRSFEVLFTPSPTRSLDGVASTRGTLILNELDKVRNRLVELRQVDGKWQRRAVEAPAFGALSVAAVDPIESDQYFLTVADFLAPTSLYLGAAGDDKRALLKSMPGFFDASPYVVRQFDATSKDGVKVPYFAVMRKDAKLDGTNPTVLYGYGGFEVSMKPFYSGVTGEAWLAQGGVYVMANIRGGGEFGPRWHQAALKDKRQRSFDDFIAVAQDLIARKVTSPRHLGIMGGSNGGLLVGAALTQRPDLFNAVVSQVPLLDMRRYHKLLAGPWMVEYAPDDPRKRTHQPPTRRTTNGVPNKRYPQRAAYHVTRDDPRPSGRRAKMAAADAGTRRPRTALLGRTRGRPRPARPTTTQQAQMWP
ncbi:prolyl oligopeptidase family serine peptidase [Massilia cavernae]|uniref:prolyl oligopeptidase family serine peptidase n=1 Tax=Massilia cavernae TaxID=2320864 RepID=UPI001E318B8C|nr:prolyl oligopeptidase family serine peptidase [Massilia cavernae]